MCVFVDINIVRAHSFIFFLRRIIWSDMRVGRAFHTHAPPLRDAAFDSFTTIYLFKRFVVIDGERAFFMSLCVLLIVRQPRVSIAFNWRRLHRTLCVCSSLFRFNTISDVVSGRWARITFRSILLLFAWTHSSCAFDEQNHSFCVLDFRLTARSERETIIQIFIWLRIVGNLWWFREVETIALREMWIHSTKLNNKLAFWLRLSIPHRLRPIIVTSDTTSTTTTTRRSRLWTRLGN